MASSLVLLVVEDEPLIRISTADLLNDAGFTVLEAEDAEEAITILESRDDVRIVFSDIDLGSAMDGRGLLHLVAAQWPPIKLFATSGRVFPGMVDKLPPQATFFAKPYDPNAVIGAFRSSLET